MADPGSPGGPDGPIGTGEPDPAIAPTMQLWSCDTQESVYFYLHHAWLLLRGMFLIEESFDHLKPDERKQAIETLMLHFIDYKEARTMPVKSGCTVEVLLLLRDYVSAYVNPDGSYAEKGLWNFYDGVSRATGETALAGVQCWKLLEVGHFLKLDVWPTSRETGRRADGDQPTHAHAHVHFLLSNL